MLKSIFINRYTITFAIILFWALLWNLFVIFNDEGILYGRVIGPQHLPVEGATVILSEKTLLVTAPRDEVTTDVDGFFRFEGHNLYHLYLKVKKKNTGLSSHKEVRLYFRGQNKTLKEPLILGTIN